MIRQINVRAATAAGWLTAVLGLVTALAPMPPAVAQEPPDLIVYGGKIVTVDDGFSIAQALAVRDGRIVAVGSDAAVRGLAGGTTRQIPLHGRTVLPGLIDSHVHAVSAATYEFDHPVPEMNSIADIQEYIRQRAAVTPEGEPIRLQQVFVTRLDERRFPTRRELDAAAPRHPVVYRTGPDAALNSLALELCGIDKATALPEGSPGRIERDPQTGEATGILRGTATQFIKLKFSSNSPDSAQRLELLRRLMQDYNSVGITSISDRNAGESDIAAYQALFERGEATCRVFMYYSLNADAPLAEIEKRLEAARQHPLHTHHPMLWLRGVKVFLDGGMLTGSAYLRQPWGVSTIYGITDPDYRGDRKIDPDRLFQISRMALSKDLQMTAHSVGDAAVHALLDAYEEVNREFPVREHRPCITHCNFMSREAIDKMQRLGVVADLQPAWLWLDGATLQKHFGQQRLEFFQPYKSLFNAGVIVGGGSDHMQKIGSLRSVNPYNPFLGMWITVRRIPRKLDSPLHEEQTINRQQAIRLYTINNAYLTFEERFKGSLEPDKWADFIVLDRDLLTCPIDDVRDTQVLATYLGGKLVAGRKDDFQR
jgi:predicted amidohydrolase YtcJ